MEAGPLGKVFGDRKPLGIVSQGLYGIGLLQPRSSGAFDDARLDADLASILGMDERARSFTEMLDDRVHRPAIERLWHDESHWAENLRWYIMALLALQVVLFASILLREGSLIDDFGLVASTAGS